MFSCRQKREISDKIQQILRETNHPELSSDEIRFKIHVSGAADWSFANITNNGATINPSIDKWNEDLDV